MRQQTLLKIMRLLRSELHKRATILEISKKLGIGYRPAYNHITSMENEKIIKIERIGNAKSCVLNLDNAKCRRLLEEVDAQKKEEIYKEHPKIKAVIESLISKLTTEFMSDIHSIILFGSYAKGGATKTSDIDLLFIVTDLKNKALRESIERESASYQYSHNLKVSPLLTDIKEFKKMLETEGLNVGKEARNHGISLYGSEMFWRLVA
ncbi:MAG: nucleotidyltransferase domain-containing protein [Candidatus Aenigmarchaeota archaeon]|nr:nucleotidyltransferase domain-containing protein [Candidatus Aenigmarchaeota archaeon]